MRLILIWTLFLKQSKNYHNTNITNISCIEFKCNGLAKV